MHLNNNSAEKIYRLNGFSYRNSDDRGRLPLSDGSSSMNVTGKTIGLLNTRHPLIVFLFSMLYMQVQPGQIIEGLKDSWP